MRKLVLLLCSSCAWACTERAAGNPVPFEMAGNKIFVQARIPPSPPLRFILDTGAPVVMLDNSRVQALGFERQAISGRTGGAGEAPVAIRRLAPKACVDVGGTGLETALLALDLTAPSRADGLRVDGLIGGDFYKRYIVAIDYEARHIRVLEPDFEYNGPGMVLPISVEGGHMYATASVEGIEGRFLVDTGIRAALILNAPFTREHHFLEGRAGIPQATIGMGAGGESRGGVFRLRDFRWGGLHIRDMVAVGSLDRTGAFASPAMEGMIGAELLRRFRVYLDYPHGRLILERTAHSDDLFTYDQSGTFLIGDGPNLEEVRILRVFSNSPAAEAGLRDGDVIVAMDGRKAGLEQIRQRFLAERRYQIEVLRAGRRIRTALYTRDMTVMPRLPFAPAPGPPKFVFCIACHDTSAKLAPLRGLAGISRRLPERAIRDIILNGRAAMPSFRYRIPAEQIEDIIAYIEGL